MKLLDSQRVGQRTEKWWLHTGDYGEDQITVEIVEDVEPIFERVKRQRDAGNKGDFRFVASIPPTVIDEACRINAKTWGIRPGQVFQELMTNKTDRAKSVWRTLTHGRDYRKFQHAG